MPPPEAFGPWLLLERVASGLMAEVFLVVRADDPSLPPCAVKRLLPSLREDGELVALFEEEARLSALLSHPAFPAVRARGSVGGVPYLAYDYLPGKDLRALGERLRSAGALLPVGLCVHVAAEVAGALDHVHRLRGEGGEPLLLVHNDVSPANVLLGFDGAVRLIDLGIARAAPGGLAVAREVRGKAAYLSPEAVEGRAVDRRADVYSLGVVLHELLTGERLYPARGPAPAKARRGPLPSSAFRKEVPQALEAVVQKALAREPLDRYPWALEMRAALLPHAKKEAGPALVRVMEEAFPEELARERARGRGP